MKLTKEQKDNLKAMKAGAKEVGVKLITVPEVVTIAWVRAFPGAKMIAVSTSYYDQEESDKFRRKTGEYYALLRQTDHLHEFIQLPLGDLPDDLIEEMLQDMFVI